MFRNREADVVQAPSRRARVRAATTEEIKQTARRILVGQGPAAMTLRAIARDMGMTAPAIYRYFDSHEDLLGHVVADIFSEIAAEIRAAIVTAGGASNGDMTAKLVAACRQFRSWALDHRAEFGLLFGTPLPSLEGMHDDATINECAAKFSGVFFALFLELWLRHPFPVPAPDEIDPGLRAQLERYRDGLGADLPVGAMVVFLRCWMRLYGAVSLEVFGHLHFALDDAAPMFEIMLSELAPMVGLAYSPAPTA
jgi:AcrR family transcriptional regulator